MTFCLHCDKELYPGQTVIYSVHVDGKFCDKDCAEDYLQDEFYNCHFRNMDID